MSLSLRRAGAAGGWVRPGPGREVDWGIWLGVGDLGVRLGQGLGCVIPGFLREPMKFWLF